MSNRFEKLKIYKKAHELVIKVYRITRRFPAYEALGITSQIRRANTSTVANIVEGNARNHRKELIQFLYLSNGSLEEVKYYQSVYDDL